MLSPVSISPIVAPCLRSPAKRPLGVVCANAIILPLALAACVAAPSSPTSTGSYAQAPSPTAACGIQSNPPPVGTAVTEATFSQGDRPFTGFNRSPVPIVSAQILAAPCVGRLIKSDRPLGFRFIPRPGYTGTDSYVIQGCTARGQCLAQAAVITIR